MGDCIEDGYREFDFVEHGIVSYGGLVCLEIHMLYPSHNGEYTLHLNAQLTMAIWNTKPSDPFLYTSNKLHN